jgi:hypothetical protein
MPSSGTPYRRHRRVLTQRPPLGPHTLVDVVSSRLNAHPEEGKFNFAIEAMSALPDSYPCPKDLELCGGFTHKMCTVIAD